MTLSTDEMALDRQIRALASEVRALRAKHESRIGNRAADRARPTLQKRPPKTDRPLCGARCKTKAGAPCLARVVVDRDAAGRVRIRTRCHIHGGRSTGAKTLEGKKRVRDLAVARQRDAKGRWLPQPHAEGAPT